ncbi:Ribonuclease H-like superfamily protein [Rhynchospora pubera]|uniref:Ribonuclease H-like superfamily protein n=1 Tax=Rhynchospora pubera TaxID=906938 RepID=A0AAV8H3L2_9POAL|nr:Ribonuclease H-like superfamily protein [Rhynchospora pubera]
MHNAPHFPEELYKLIWKTANVLPRARLFLWRAVREALPVDQVISSRLSKPPQGCPLCGETNETGVHVMFKCTNAQPIWRMSQFDLTTVALPDSMELLLTYLAKEVGEENWPYMVSVLWSWWKDRCKIVYEGSRLNPTKTIAVANYWPTTLQKATLCNKLTRQSEQVLHQNGGLPLPAFSCWVDASWVRAGVGGCGKAYVLYSEEGDLGQYQMLVGEASSPYHAELLSLKEAVRSVHKMGISSCVFYTDCLLLHDIISGSRSPEAADWWAYDETLELVLEWNRHKQFVCFYVNRDQNQLADELAKFARVRDISTVDFTFPTICIPQM